MNYSNPINTRNTHNKAFHSKFNGKIEYMQKEGPSKILDTCNPA